MEWKTVKLGDIASFSQGVQVDVDEQQMTCENGYVRFIRIVDYTKGNEIPRYIKYPGRKYIVDDTDIVMIRYGTPGRVARGFNGAIANNMFKISVNEDIIDKTYAFYYLSQESIYQTLMASNSSSTMPAINFKTVEKLDFPLPPLETQRRIATILSSLDDKIENNNRINRNLEEQAQALFKSWFVDFEPWGGTMPEDWREGTLGEIIAEIESGSRPKGGAQTSGVPSIGAEKIERFGVYDYSGEKYVSEEYFNKMKRGHVKDGDVMLYKDGAYTGKCSMALDGFPYKECAVNEHVFLLRTKEAKYQFYLYLNMIQESVRSMIYTLACSKAAQPGLNTSEVLGVKTIIPTEAVMMDFNSKVANMMHTIANNCLESQRLATLRDTLLPKLMKGEIAL